MSVLLRLASPLSDSLTLSLPLPLVSLRQPSSGQRQSSQQRRHRLRAADQAGSTEDIATHLVEAVSGGKGTRNKVLRSVFRKAVEHEYDAVQAVARMQAVYSGQYSFENVQSVQGQPFSKATVRYRKGLGSRGWYEDEIDLLNEALLRDVIRLPVAEQASKEEREVVKPVNLSKASPRIFWSLVRHFGNDLVHAVAAILSDVDPRALDWLVERKRELSEKAKENAAQAAERMKLKEDKMKKQNDHRKRKRDEEAKSEEKAATPALPALRPDWLKDPALLAQLSLESVLAAEHLEAWQTALLDGSCLTLLDLPEPVEWAERFGLRQTADQVDFIFSAALHLTHEVIFHELIKRSMKLKVALFKLRVRSLSEFCLWASAPAGLFEGLLQLDASLARLHLDSEKYFAVDDVEVMVSRAKEVCSLWPSLQALQPGEESIEETAAYAADVDAAVRNREVDASVWEENWLFEGAEVGQRVRVVVQEETSCWEDGSIVAFLPSTEEEPMALWRVRLDGSAGDSDDVRLGRFEDLEESELQEARERSKAFLVHP